LYRTDIVQFLQISRDWFHGKPFYFDNLHGLNLKLHLAAVSPVAGVFTIPFGVYGLAVLLFIFWLLCIKETISFLHTLNPPLSLYFFIFAGPITYYLIDDNIFGFHLELLFAPLSILFTIFLIKENKFKSIIFGLLLFSIRQDGIVLASLLHLQVNGFLWSYKKISTKAFVSKSVLLLSFYFALFILALFVIQCFSDGTAEGSRVMQAFIKIDQFFSSGFKNVFVYLFYLSLRFLLFLSPFYILLAYYINLKQLGITTFSVLILLCMHFIAGAFYIPNIEFSVTWAPRFSSIFGLMSSGVILACYFNSGKNIIALNIKNPQHKYTYYIITAFIMQAACYTFVFTRYVFALERPQIVWHESTPAKLWDVFKKGESKFSMTYHKFGGKFRLVANDLPDFYPIALSNYLHTYFHRHDTIFLPARKFQSAWRMPRAVIVDHSDYSGDEIDEMQAMLPNSKKHDLGEFTLIVLPEDEKYFRPLIQNPS
jgi:hypothetical protein